jgi:nucleotide-binding universal stress UspA family protein
MDSMRRAQEENSRKVVSRALDICKQKQVSATAAVVEGDPKEAICQAVEEMRADLLVLGSRGLGMVKRYTPTAMAIHIELPPVTDSLT